jgi:hypothetical protein
VPDQKGGLTEFISLTVLLESFLGMWLVTTATVWSTNLRQIPAPITYAEKHLAVLWAQAGYVGNRL